MDLSETALVLGKCAAFDKRTVGESDVRAWHEVLEPVPFDAGLRAVTAHYTTEDRPMMPAHVMRYWRQEKGLDGPPQPPRFRNGRFIDPPASMPAELVTWGQEAAPRPQGRA